MSPRGRSRFGDLLLELQLVGDDALRLALDAHAETGRPLARLLSEAGHLDEERLAKAVATRLGLEMVDLQEVRVHPRVLERIPASLAARFGILPYAVKRTPQAEVLYLVMVDPLDAAALREAQSASGCQVRAMVAAAGGIDDAIERHYHEQSTTEVTAAPRASSSPANWPAPSSPPRSSSSTGSLRPATSGHAEHVRISTTSREVPKSSPRLFSGPDPWATDPGRRTPERAPIPSGDSTLIDFPAPVVPTAPESNADTLETDRHMFELGRGSPPMVLDEKTGHPFSADLVTGPQTAPLDPPPPTKPLPAEPPPAWLSLEVPVDYKEGSHPFEGPSLGEVPVGLGETAIIPEVDNGHEPFEPPPPPERPAGGWGRLGSSDIPTTADEVRAREVEVQPSTSDDIEDIEELDDLGLDEVEELEALEDDVEEIDPSGDIPTSEPVDVAAALAGGAATRAPSVPGAPIDETAFEAERLVQDLEAGRALSAEDSARLVLALGRVLLEREILPREALLEALGPKPE